MRFDLRAMIRRARKPRRRAIPIRDIVPTGVLASNLFRAVYVPVVEAWTAALPRIEAEYGRTLGELTADSPADLTGLLDGIEGELRRILLELTPQLRNWALRVEGWHRDKWRGAVLSATGVDLLTLVGPADVRQTLEAAIEWNVGLVKDVSDQVRQRISSAVFAGLNQRKAARDVAREIREAVGMGRKRALRIASDQLTKVTAELDEERRRQAGLDVWKWRHSGKLHPREWHRARDGNLYSETAAMQGREVEGQTVQAPPDRDDWPGRPPYCGCRAQAVVVFD